MPNPLIARLLAMSGGVGAAVLVAYVIYQEVMEERNKVPVAVVVDSVFTMSSHYVDADGDDADGHIQRNDLRVDEDDDQEEEDENNEQQSDDENGETVYGLDAYEMVERQQHQQQQRSLSEPGSTRQLSRRSGSAEHHVETERLIEVEHIVIPSHHSNADDDNDDDGLSESIVSTVVGDDWSIHAREQRLMRKMVATTVVGCNGPKFVPKLFQQDCNTPLLAAIYHGSMEDFLEILHEEEARISSDTASETLMIHQTDMLGRTPTDFCAVMGEPDMMNMLLERGGRLTLGIKPNMRALARKRNQIKKKYS